jgi:ATP-dependent RNA helicase DHX37/DHR1
MSNTNTKTKLKRAFYLHKAGLELSNDDQELLFPEKLQIAQTNRDSVTIKSKDSVPIPLVEKPIESTPSPAAAPTGSVGSNLLLQFKKLSAEKGVEKSHNEDDKDDESLEGDYDDDDEEGSDVSEQDDDDAEEEDDDDDDDDDDEAPLLVHDGPAYEPVEMKMPVDQHGKIILSEELALKSSNLLEDNLSRKEKLKYILQRDPKIQASRTELPVCGMEQEIVEAIGAHDIIILCGETGSGKSTQVPFHTSISQNNSLRFRFPNLFMRQAIQDMD